MHNLWRAAIFFRVDHNICKPIMIEGEFYDCRFTFFIFSFAFPRKMRISPWIDIFVQFVVYRFEAIVQIDLFINIK